MKIIKTISLSRVIFIIVSNAKNLICYHAIILWEVGCLPLDSGWMR